MNDGLAITWSPGSAGAPGDAPAGDPAAGRLAATVPDRTPLVGREADTTRVLTAIAGGDRLVTIAGPGGVGKTCLGTEVAHRAIDEFAGAVLFVPIDFATEAPAAIAAIAERAGWDASDGPVLDVVHRGLSARRTLLVLDNCEQVPDLGGAVHDLLMACPDLVVVATSRHPLGLASERLVELDPLAVPAPHAAVAEIAASAAATVLTNAARRRTPGFAVTDDNAADIARLCAQLDGLPLALELAAARLHLLTPAEMSGLLDQRFDLLEQDAPDRSPHHRRLYATIDWSYQLLDPDDRQRFDVLGTFTGGFTLEAAADVAGVDVVTMLDTLDRLVDHHLVRPVGERAGSRRFDLFESIREFARAQLERDGRLDAARDAHARWALATAEEWASGFTDGARQDRAVGVFDVERGNFRAALGHLIEQRAADAAQRLATAHWRYWIGHGSAPDGLRLLTAALALDDDGDSGLVRAAALQAAGDLTEVSGDLPGALPLLERAAAMFAALDRRDRLAAAWNSIALVERELGRLDDAERHHRDALAAFIELGDRRSQAVSLNGLGVVAWRRGEFATAGARYAEALEHVQALGDRHGEVLVTINLGVARRKAGDFDGALAAHRRALELGEQLDIWSAQMNTYLNIADVEIARHELAAAAEAVDRAEALARGAGSRQGISHVHFYRGEIAVGRGRLGEALGEHVASLQQSVALHRPFEMAESCERIGALLAELGDHDLAARTLDLAIIGSAASGGPSSETTAWRERLAAAGHRPTGTADWPAGVDGLLPELVAAAERHAGARRRGLTTDHPLRGLGLTAREADVTRLLVARRTDAEIAAELYIGLRTVATHVSSVLRKLGVSSRRDVPDRLVALGIDLDAV